MEVMLFNHLSLFRVNDNINSVKKERRFEKSGIPACQGHGIHKKNAWMDLDADGYFRLRCNIDDEGGGRYDGRRKRDDDQIGPCR